MKKAKEVKEVRFDKIFRKETTAKIFELLKWSIAFGHRYPFRTRLLKELIQPYWPFIKSDLEGWKMPMDQVELSFFFEDIAYRVYFGRKGTQGDTFTDDERLRLVAYVIYRADPDYKHDTVENVMADIRAFQKAELTNDRFYQYLNDYVQYYNREFGRRD